MTIERRHGNITRLIDNLRFSLQGLASIWRSEKSFRQEAWVIVPILPLAFWIGGNASQRALLIFSALLIFIVELLNTAVEAVVDRFGAEIHPLAKQAKDMGSAAVLVSLIIGAVVWGIIVWERLTT